MSDEGDTPPPDTPDGSAASTAGDAAPGPDDEAEDDVVWSFRGYQLGPGNFTTAMVHLFRAEITRANVWRERLDATTNWAVLTTGAAISFAFGASRVGDGTEHGVIILNTLLVTIFLMAEARRYRYYELWSYRVRLMETDFFAAMLVPPFHPSPDWAESLAENLLQPNFPISRLEAIGRRFRRNYAWIYVLLAVSWLLKVWLHPVPATSAERFVHPAQLFDNASIGPVPGQLIMAVGVLYNALLMALGWLTIGLQQATGEVLPRYGPAVRNVERRGERKGVIGSRAWFRRSGKREQLVTFVITHQREAVSRAIMAEVSRGVTAMPARGMYSGSDKDVLMCALTVTEVAQLRSVVEDADPDAFVIVTPARQVLGGGFRPLEDVPDDEAP